jgi:hypothetical protein
MLQTIDLKAYPAIKRIILAAFPGYKKHRAFISDFGPSGKNINSFWDGGSRAEYAIVHLPTTTRKALPTSTHPYFDVASRGIAGESADVEVSDRGLITLKHLPPGFALVEAGTSCGKAATAHVFFCAEDLPKQLPDGKA